MGAQGLLHALLIDDDPDFVETLGTALRAAGYTVEAYLEPTPALERIQRGPKPDVVLLDFMLPDMNGLQVMRTLEAMHVGVPVVLLAGRDNRALGVLPMHFARVFRKPFPLDSLLAELESLTGKSGQRAAAAAGR